MSATPPSSPAPAPAPAPRDPDDDGHRYNLGSGVYGLLTVSVLIAAESASRETYAETVGAVALADSTLKEGAKLPGVSRQNGLCRRVVCRGWSLGD